MKWQKLTEFADASWCPQYIRDELTETLRHFAVTMKAYDAIIPEFIWVLQQSKCNKIIDLCSGASGPWEYLLQITDKFKIDVATITLTDIAPNKQTQSSLREKYPEKIIFKEESVDAKNIDPELIGVRTIFSAFHHFTTAEAQAILQDAVDKQMPICIFEMTERSFFSFLHTPFSTILPFAQRLFRPPLPLHRLLFSYVIPIVPFVFFYDSTVSHLRTFSPEELQDMISTLNNKDSFQWETGKKKSPRSLITNTYLIGYPKK